MYPLSSMAAMASVEWAEARVMGQLGEATVLASTEASADATWLRWEVGSLAAAATFQPMMATVSWVASAVARMVAVVVMATVEVVTWLDRTQRLSQGGP